MSIRSTPTRTFALLPALVLAEQAASGRRLHPRWTPLLVWGYLQYRLSGRYRISRAGGPPGLSQGLPERLVTTGIYAYTRNPMYLGHLVFLTGLTLLTRSPVALALTAGLTHWFDERARTDHRRLTALFGAPYEAYAARVPRWLPGLPTERRDPA
jgi:protein-S-isoprenylcysteine O-methyltransferase Ste14